MIFDTPTHGVLYLLEEAIKEYRRFCQQQIEAVIPDITVDQCLVLIVLDKKPYLSQKEIATLIFKDAASVTRMIDLMVRNGFLDRTMNTRDRRKFNLCITSKGRRALRKLEPAIRLNRETALQGFSEKETTELYRSLQKIIQNCRS